MLALRPRASRTAALLAAAVTVTPLLAGSAGAASATPSVGSAGASLTALRVDSTIASIRALTASLSASTAANPDTASISISPVWSSATGDVGAVTVTPATSPKHVGAGTVALPSGLASLTGPAVDVVASAANGLASAGVTSSALGSITVLGTPLSLGSAAMNLSSRVSKTAAASSKSVTVQQLALPTIMDLLAGLGLDLSALTQGQLMALFDVVAASVGATVDTAVANLNTAVDTAQTAASSTADTVAGATALVASKQSDADAAATAVTTALAPVNASLAAINTALGLASLPTIGAALDAVSWQALTSAQTTVIDTVVGSGTSAAVDAAIAALDAANQALDAAQALLDAILALVDAITSALDTDPLAVLGGISAGTSAIAGTVGTATGHLTVGSVEILGAGIAPSSLTSGLSAVTGALASALNSITGVTFTAPKITIGAIDKSTTKSGGTATAQVTVAGLKIVLPTLTLPTSLGLPGADSLPGIDLVNGVLKSAAGTVTVAELRDSATFTQGTAAGTPGTGGGGLPTTGAPAALGVIALLAMGVGVALRRRTLTAAE